MRKKREEVEELDAKTVQQYWSFKRIFLGIILASLFFGLGGIYLWETMLKEPVDNIKNVLGVSTEEIAQKQIVIPDKGDAERILKDAQKQLLQIAPENLIASQAAIQKIINDLQSLRFEDSGIKTTVCKFICK